jgi:hypothetical protein
MVGQADHEYIVPEPDVRLESLTYSALAADLAIVDNSAICPMSERRESCGLG